MYISVDRVEVLPSVPYGVKFPTLALSTKALDLITIGSCRLTSYRYARPAGHWCREHLIQLNMGRLCLYDFFFCSDLFESLEWKGWGIAY